jgi:diguanylate cyclase (GGDEF)-like protein
VFKATIVHAEGQGSSVVRDVLVDAGCSQLTMLTRPEAGTISDTELIVLDASDMRLLRKLVATQVPIIMVCAERDIDAAFLAGATDCVTAPVRARELEGRVRRALRQRTELEHRKVRDRKKSDTIRALAEERKRLEQLVCIDPLTGIASRQHTLSLLEQECKRSVRDGAPLGLVMLDVDFFQAYNDAYGTAAGDACLRQIAKAMTRCLGRPAEFVGRYGGDELVAVLPGTDERGAMMVAETLRAAVEALAVPHERSLSRERVTVTAGYTCLPPLTEWTAEAAIAVAETALRRARTGGHNRVDGEVVIPGLDETEAVPVSRATALDTPLPAIATAATQVFA